MGTDIHVIAQVKENGQWIENPVAIFPNPYHQMVKDRLAESIEEKDQSRIDYFTERLKKEAEFKTTPERGRCYDWFAVLADVRNGRGFAGIRTSDGFNIISEPRGLPTDFQPTYEESEDELVEVWIGDHSFSYVHLEDFDSFDWNQVTLKTGVIPIEEYRKLKGTNECPESWSGGISGPNIVTLSEEQADSASILDPSIRYYVQYNWTVLYREWFAEQHKNWIEPMRELREKYEDVRIVFGFDS